MILAAVPSFDGGRAFQHLERQVAFGPRIPGSSGHAKTAEWLVRSLEGLAPVVEKRACYGRNALTGEEMEGRNIIASFRPEADDRIFFGAHWDSRTFADLDPDSARAGEPVPGADDAASGVAVLLTVAEVLHRNPPPLGVDLIFFDLEDQGVSGDIHSWCLGSRSLAAGASLTGFSPRFGVVVDMVGGRNLRLTQDRFSRECCPDLLDEIFRIGREIDPAAFSSPQVVEVYDDHVPFIDAGIPTVLLIGFGFPEWHTTRDLPDRCSPESLEIVGTLLLQIIYGDHKIP